MIRNTSPTLDTVFGALADPTRRAILARLAQSDASVSELEALAREEAQGMLERINARAHALQDQDSCQNALGKFAVGAYVLPTSNKKDKTAE